MTVHLNAVPLSIMSLPARGGHGPLSLALAVTPARGHCRGRPPGSTTDRARECRCRCPGRRAGLRTESAHGLGAGPPGLFSSRRGGTGNGINRATRFRADAGDDSPLCDFETVHLFLFIAVSSVDSGLFDHDEPGRFLYGH